MAKSASESDKLVAKDPDTGEDREVGDNEVVLDGFIRPKGVQQDSSLRTVTELEEENTKLKEQIEREREQHKQEMEVRDAANQSLLDQQSQLLGRIQQLEEQHKEEVEVLQKEVEDTKEHAERKNPAVRTQAVEQAVKLLGIDGADSKKLVDTAKEIEQYVTGTGEGE